MQQNTGDIWVLYSDMWDDGLQETRVDGVEGTFEYMAYKDVWGDGGVQETRRDWVQGTIGYMAYRDMWRDGVQGYVG